MALIGFIALLSCSGNGGDEDDSSYTAARRTFDQAIASETTRWAGPVASTYLQRLADGDEAPGNEVLQQFQSDVSELNGSVCQRIETILELARDGPGDKKAARIDQARAKAQDIVFAITASALLKQALAAPPDQQDSLLTRLNVEAKSTEGTSLEGVAALREAGILEPGDSLTLVAPSTEDWEGYEDWASREARMFASRVDVLTGPTRTKIEECASS